ncbi:MAG: LysR family transcriptional regulator [Proteobacteria bacterium]|nr:LysR family transcriptional regulator [Pseudomonadota bacterium]
MAFQRIPPIQCLVTFEAVARLRSASRAAEELCVTTSAVSHRIRQLESHLGFTLFRRGEFNLTADGAAYIGHVRSGLASLEQMTGQPGGKPAARLRLAVTPTFCRQFLMPRLELFRNAYPEIDLVLQVSIPLLDVKAETADLEVRFGIGGYTDVEYRPIVDDVLSPACSPSYLHEFGPFEGFASEAEVARARLIRSPLEPWSPWFAHCGMAPKEPSVGTQFNDLGLVYDAAATGFGVALVRLKLGAAWLESGRLVRLSPRSVSSLHKHFLCWAPGALERWECSAFAEWLMQALVAPLAQPPAA